MGGYLPSFPLPFQSLADGRWLIAILLMAILLTAILGSTEPFSAVRLTKGNVPDTSG